MLEDKGLIVFFGAAFLLGTWLEEHSCISDAVYFVKDNFMLILACVVLVAIGIMYIKNRIEK